MTYYVICTTDAAPCPPDHQVEVLQVGLEEMAQMGITPTSLVTAVGLGFGLVLSLVMVGYVAGLVIQGIRKL